MKRILIYATCIAIGTGAALAPASAAPPPGGPAAAPAAAPPAPPPPPPGDADNAGPPPPPPGGPGAPPPPGRRPPPPPPPSKAAHFRLETGTVSLDVKCADDEPMKACADIALQMLDKAATLPAH